MFRELDLPLTKEDSFIAMDYFVLREGERRKLLDEELLWANVFAKRVAGPLHRLSQDQDEMHDSTLSPLKTLKDQAQRRTIICEQFLKLFGRAMDENWTRERLLSEGRECFEQCRSACRESLEQLFEQRDVSITNAEEMRSLLEQEMESVWPPLLMSDEETIDDAFARISFIHRTALQLFHEVEAEHIVAIDAYWNAAHRGSKIAEGNMMQLNQAQQSFNQSALGLVKNGDVAALSALLDAEVVKGHATAWVEQLREPFGVSVIHMAAHYGHVRIVAVLTKTTPTCASLLDQQGYSPIFHAITACSVRHLGCIRELLKANARVAMQRCHGMTPLIWACRCNNSDAVEFLAHECRILISVPEEKSQMTALHYACQRGFVRAVMALLLGGAAVDVQDATGRTPLMRALYSKASAKTVNTILCLLCECASPAPTTEQVQKFRSSFPGDQQKLQQMQMVLDMYVSE